MKLPSLHRKRTEPPGIWRGEPRLYSRWRYQGTGYSLLTVSISHGPDPCITLEYHGTAAMRERLSASLPL